MAEGVLRDVQKHKYFLKKPLWLILPIAHIDCKASLKHIHYHTLVWLLLASNHIVRIASENSITCYSGYCYQSVLPSHFIVNKKVIADYDWLH